jgi:hypothetical protein
MRYLKRFTTSTVLVCACLAPVAAADVVDQNQTDVTGGMSALDTSNVSAQSFQQSASNISGAGILLDPGQGGQTGLVTISLWTTLPDGNGTMLASASAVGTEGAWVDVFWSPVSITAGTTYFLDFSGDGPLVASGSVNDPYANGQVYAGPSYLSFPDFDFTFRTYSSDIPTPGTLGLLSIIGLSNRRRRRSI